MGDKSLATASDAVKESTYSVISYPASQMPEQYLNLVRSKWMRTLRHGNEYFKLADSDTYYGAYQRFIHILLNRPNSILRLAVLSDDHDVVLGWSLIEVDVLHYVYVQHEHRNQGIGKSLVPVPIHTITHLTKAGMSAWHNKLPHAKFNPFQ